METYVAGSPIKCLLRGGREVRHARAVFFSFTFKENCPDTRNTRVIDIVRELEEYGIEPVISDPRADALEAERLYVIHFRRLEEVGDMDAVVLATAHEEFRGLSVSDMNTFYGDLRKILLVVKGIIDRKIYKEAGYLYWRR